MSLCALTLPKVVLGKQIIAAASDRVKGSKQKWDKDQTGDGIVQKEGHKPITNRTGKGRSVEADATDGRGRCRQQITVFSLINRS